MITHAHFTVIIFIQGNMKPGIAVELKTESVACHDLMNVTDSGNTELYNHIDEQSVFNVTQLCLANIWSTQQAQNLDFFIVPDTHLVDQNGASPLSLVESRPNTNCSVCEPLSFNALI